MRANEVPPVSPPSPPPTLFRKRVPEDAPVTARSAVLFRFGEQCNYHCPMCSNTGERSLFFHPTDELLRRAAFLHDLGFRRAVITGGEATIHPGFWTVVERLAAYGMAWDTNTHGRTYATPGFAQRAVDTGLRARDRLAALARAGDERGDLRHQRSLASRHGGRHRAPARGWRRR